MAKQPVPKPQPVVTETVCSLCNEEWSAHGDSPTVLDCIRLLKAKRYVPTPLWKFDYGFTCSSCGRWVPNNQYHACWAGPSQWWFSTAGNTSSSVSTFELSN